MPSFSSRADAEVIIVGGGPAGSVTAAALAERGHRVLLIDKARFPRHKACSDYLNAGGAKILARLGILDEALATGGRPIAGMSVHAPNGSRFAADFSRVEQGAHALGLSRHRLDHLLLERAKAAGVTVCERAHVRSLLRDGERVVGVAATIDGTREELRAPLVVGADGRNSIVSRALGVSVDLRWPRKTGIAAHYANVPGLDGRGEMHVVPGAYAGLAPIEGHLTNVTIVTDVRAVERRSGSVEELFAVTIDRMPAVAEKLAGAERVGGLRGVGPMAHRSRRVTGDGVLLVGDAASFLDPFVGEGIYQALRGGLLAAPVISDALRAGDTSARSLRPYVWARRRGFTAKREVSWIVQGFINSPPLMNYVTDRLARRDELGLTLSGVLGNLTPAGAALSPVFLARLLRP